MRRVVWPMTILVALASSLACIEERRRQAPDLTQTDTDAPDSIADTDAAPADTSAPDADTRPEPDTPPSDADADLSDAPDWETATSDCADDNDCADRTAGMCSQWLCDDGWCTEVPVTGTACDDGDQCTVDDFCDQGVCAAGWVLTCDMLAPDCWAATGDTCAPASGCPGVAAPAGTSCYDGFGLEAGACHNGWVVPADRCDGGGLCIDTSALVPTTIHPLAGQWHTIAVRRPPGAPFESLSATVTIGPGATLTLSGARSTDGWSDEIGSADAGAQGQLCAAFDGLLQLSIAGATYQGVATPDASFLVFQGADDAMGLMLRATGDREDVTGTYNVVALEGADASRSVATRVGQMKFASGCMTGSMTLEAAVGIDDPLELVPVPLGSCLSFADGRWRLSFTLMSGGAPLSVAWGGAIGPDADMLLLEHEGATFRGTLLLTRAREEVSADDLRDNWYFASRRGGLDSNAGTPDVPLLEAGLLRLGESTSDLYGRLTGEGEDRFIGQWWFPGTDGRYSQRAAIGDQIVNHTGFITPRPDVIVAWIALDPESDPSRPQTLRLRPKEGSLLVGVRWRAFIE